MGWEWYMQALKKYAVFSGRARRKEYWFFLLWYVIISIGCGIVDAILGTHTARGVGLLGTLYALAVLIPSLAVAVRRLHDTGRTGWWILIGLIPVIGWIVILVFMFLDGQPGDNEYGPNPKAGNA